MDVADKLEELRENEQLLQRLVEVQDIVHLQEQYQHFLNEGIAQRKGYNLAPVDILGTSVPGQTTYKLSL